MWSLYGRKLILTFNEGPWGWNQTESSLGRCTPDTKYNSSYANGNLSTPRLVFSGRLQQLKFAGMWTEIAFVVSTITGTNEGRYSNQKLAQGLENIAGKVWKEIWRDDIVPVFCTMFKNPPSRRVQEPLENDMPIPKVIIHSRPLEKQLLYSTSSKESLANKLLIPEGRISCRVYFEVQWNL